MQRFSRKNPFQQKIDSMHLDEVKSMLQAFKLREALGETENRPLMDMYETADEIVLEFDMPGFACQDMSLSIHGTILLLDATRPNDQNDEAGRYIRIERSFGRFHHTVNIPGSIDTNRIKAEYRSGVLRVKCPKIEDRRVPIKEIIIE